MEENYVLIDFENVQPKNLELLSKHPFKIFVFVGANQTKVSFDLASAMQTLGRNAKYIKITGNGPNALDFHIAFYVGEFASNNQNAHFYIISKDKGFDPLVAHLKSRGFRIQRSSDLAEIPILRVSGNTSTEEKITTIVANLISRGQSRPRKVKTLQNTINTLFTKKLDNEEMQKVVSSLSQKKYIQINDGNVSYNLPKTH
ncbi:MAG: PIN domain-containing protein [Candidatus Thiodiazotropha sp.]